MPSTRARKAGPSVPVKVKVKVEPKSEPTAGSSSDNIGHKNDVSCFVCHWENLRVEKVDCPCKTCPTNFHQKCINQPGYPAASVIVIKGVVISMDKCQECVASTETSLERWRYVTRSELSTILKVLCDRWIKWLKVKANVDTHYGSILSTNNYEQPVYEDFINCRPHVVDMKILENLVALNQFQTIEGFVTQLKWMLHNSFIFNGRTDGVTAVTSEFVTMAFTDLNDIIWTCVDCQLKINTKPQDRSKNFFVLPCRTPHPVIWAKIAGFPWWPAKLIGTKKSNEDTVEVFFFGDYTRGFMNVKKCKSYSKQKIDSTKKSKNMSAKFNKAIKEADAYIAALAQIKQFGLQVVPKTASELPNNITPDFMKTLFPTMEEEVLKDMLNLFTPHFQL